MLDLLRWRSHTPTLLLLLIIIQLFCAVFFIGDAVADFVELGGESFDYHLVIETFASLGLLLAVVFEITYLLELLRRKAHLETALKTTQAAIHDVIESLFVDWGLTRAEQDVANFLVKGYSTTEIAEFRGSAEGTVKAQLNAIYRKSGSANRAELLSCVIDNLMGQQSSDQTATP